MVWNGNINKINNNIHSFTKFICKATYTLDIAYL